MYPHLFFQAPNVCRQDAELRALKDLLPIFPALSFLFSELYKA